MSLPQFLSTLPKLINSSTFLHPVDAAVGFVLSGKFSHFTCNGRTVPGVHDLLRKAIWPNYQYDQATLNETGQTAAASTSRRWMPNHSKLDPATRGKRKGVKADHVMSESLTLKRKYALSASLFSENRHKKRLKLEHCKTLLEQQLPRGDLLHSLIGEQRLLLKLLNARIPDLRLLWSTFIRYQLRPVACQLRCGIPGLVASALDNVSLNQHNKLVLIELKKGGQNYLYKHTSTPLNYPFNDKNDCVLHQWLIQLGLLVILYRHSFPQLASRMGPPMLLRINENPEAAELFPLPDWVTDRLEQLLVTIQSHRSRPHPPLLPPPPH